MMGFSIRGWVRRFFRDAAMDGIKDVFTALASDDPEVPPTVEELRAMIQAATASRALPAAKAEESEESGTKRKGR